MGKIYLIDVTNRDGVQTAKLGLSKLAKTIINMYLNEMGVYQSEFGFPTTRHESRYLRANLRLQEMGVLQPIRLEGWIRATVDDVEKAFKLVPEIKDLNLSISTSNQMINGKFLGTKNEEDIGKLADKITELENRIYNAESETIRVEEDMDKFVGEVAIEFDKVQEQISGMDEANIEADNELRTEINRIDQKTAGHSHWWHRIFK